MSNHFVFDVESVGLYGEPFAVGYVVHDELGNEWAAKMRWVHPDGLMGMRYDHDWIKGNIPLHQYDVALLYPRLEDLYNWFWGELRYWREEADVHIWADCVYPVETNFLAACVRQETFMRYSDAPYPLYDIATIAMAVGYDPTQSWPRAVDELPAHHPLADARQSAHLLMNFIKELKNMGGMYDG